MRLLIFGDVVAKIGRRALIKELPALKNKFKPDFVIINAENLAHGKGINSKTIQEMKDAGVDFFTGGNHSFSKPEGILLLSIDPTLLRPANYNNSFPGVGYRIIHIGESRVLMINLQGRVFMKDEVEDPFACFDTIVAMPEHESITLRLVDFHGETTSERHAFKWHIDGRATLLWGTHTHVQTNDATILESGMGYITDVGMTGSRDGVIGIAKEGSLAHFRTGKKLVHEFYETGPAIVSGLYTEIDTHTSRCTHLEHFTITTTV